MSTQSYEPANYFLDFWAPRDPVPDGDYIARLGPSTKLDFYQRGLNRINFEVKILEPIGDPPPGFRKGTGYGRLFSCRRHQWLGLGFHPTATAYFGAIEKVSTLTVFLKQFGLYSRGMSTAKRIRTAKEFIETCPKVAVSTIWVAYSQTRQRTFKHGMSNFPLRADGTYDPNILTEEGEQLRAVAHVDWYWPLPPRLESRWKK